MFDEIEVLLADADVTLASINKIQTPDDVEVVVKHADRLIAQAKLLGIDKQDGQTLQAWGLLEEDYVNSLTEIRDISKGQSLGLEADSSGMIGKVIAAGVLALGLLLAFIVGKLIGILFGVAENSDNLSTDAAVKAVLKGSTGDDAAKKKAEKMAKDCSEAVKAVTAGDILGKDAVRKFRFLGYPADMGNDVAWAVELLQLSTDVQTFLRKNIPDGDIPLEEAEALLDDIKTKPRKELDKYVKMSTEYLEMVFNKPDRRPEHDHLNFQLADIKLYKSSDSLTYRHNDALVNWPIGDFRAIDKALTADIQKQAEHNEKENSKLATDLKGFKVNHRTGRKLASQYLRLAVSDPIAHIGIIMRKLIITYLLDRSKWTARILKEAPVFFTVSGDIINAAAVFPEVKDAESVIDCLDIVNKNMDKLPKALEPYEKVLRPAPKNLEELASKVIEIKLEK